jgi:transcription elongation factor Elf1
VPSAEPWSLERVERELPELAGLARLHRAVEDALREHERVAGPFHPDLPSPPGVHWLHGTPLLDALDRTALAARLADVAAAVAEAVAASSAGAAEAVAEIRGSEALTPAGCAAALASFRDPAWLPASAHPRLARFVLLRAISLPARHLARAYTAPLPERWKRSRCPFCGVEAAASIGRAGTGRTLLCVLCGGRWETAETLCTGCGERNLSRFRVLASRDAGPATIETCGRCGTSVKVFGAGDVPRGPPLAVEVASVRLDLVAERDEETFRDPVALAALYPPG